MTMADQFSPTSLAGSVKKGYTRPLDIKHGRIDMGHGAGGKAAAQLIDELFLAALDNPYLRQGDDGAALPLPAFDPAGGRLVMATDGHVVSLYSSLGAMWAAWQCTAPSTTWPCWGPRRCT